MERRRLINVALGREPADVIVAGGRVLSVHTGEILRADVAIAGGRIAAVGELPSASRGPRTRIIDAAGLFVSPGLIDGHLHYLTPISIPPKLRSYCCATALPGPRTASTGKRLSAALTRCAPSSVRPTVSKFA